MIFPTLNLTQNSMHTFRKYRVLQERERTSLDHIGYKLVFPLSPPLWVEFLAPDLLCSKSKKQKQDNKKQISWFANQTDGK